MYLSHQKKASIVVMEFSLALSLVVLFEPSFCAAEKLLAPSIELYPSVSSVYEGVKAHFNCTAYRFDSIQWTFNNTAIRRVFPELKPKHSFQGIKWAYSVIEIPTELVHNGSKINCYGVIISNQILYPSDDGQLLVQGPPGKVLGFQGTNISTTSLRFNWSPPNHVPGIPPCCSNYSVNISNADSGVTFSDIISETFVIVDVQPHHLCSVYEVQISAFNDLGEGELFNAKWSLGGYFEADQASVTVSYNEQNELNVGVNVTIDGYCLNNLDNVTLSVECDSVSEVLTHTKGIMADRKLRMLQSYVSLMVPQSHHDTSCTSEVALENNVNLQGIAFNTHDVQEVAISVLPGAICVTCQYLPHSPAQGCVLVASLIGVDSDIEMSLNIAANESRDCLNELDRGRYRVRVYDWQNNGRGGEYVFTDVVDVPQAKKQSNDTLPVNDTSNGRLSTKQAVLIAVLVPAAVAIIMAAAVATIVVALVHIVRGRKNKDPARKGTDDTDSGRLLVQNGPAKTVNNNSLRDILDDHDLSQWTYFKCSIDDEPHIAFTKK